VTNIAVRLGDKTTAAGEHALLVNCHLDSVVDAPGETFVFKSQTFRIFQKKKTLCPGATDDAVSCATMMDVLHVLSRRRTILSPI